jgi:ectoine hydroxylase-related dioxygenase (phytanoyl-CoA dioxygenase family)
MIDLSLLETQGFLVVPDFLNSKEVAVLKWGHDQLRSKNNKDLESKHTFNEDFGKMFAVPNAVASFIYPKIKTMSEQITASTDIKLNFFNKQCSGFYADLNFINGNNGNDSTLVWHQDQGAWTLHQQSYNYINFYIMVNKENPNITNLSVVPQNMLTDRIPTQINKIVRQGAQRFFPKDKETLVKNDNTDEEYTLAFNIEEIAKSPNLLPGDVLLVRGDTIHRSQDNLSPRVAASFRVFQNTAILNKQVLLSGGEEKQRYLKNNYTVISAILQAFEYYGRDDITYTEYFNHANMLL